MVSQLSQLPGPNGINYLNVLPDFTNNWDIARRGVRHADRGPVVVGVVSRARSPAAAATSRSGCSRRKSERDSLGAVLFFQLAHYVLRPWPWILVGALLDHRVPAALRHPEGVSGSRSGAARARHRVSGDAEVPAGRLRRADGGRARRGELVDDPHAPELGRVVPGARLLPPLHQDGRRPSGTTSRRAASPRCCCSSSRRRSCSCSTRRRTRSTSSSRSAPAPGCSTWCAGSGGA